MDSGTFLNLALVALFYGMAFRALRTGRIKLNAGSFSRDDGAVGFWFFVSVFLLLGTALLVKVLLAGG